MKPTLLNLTYVAALFATLSPTASAQLQLPMADDSGRSFAKAYELSSAFREISKRTLPAVVSIETEGKTVRRAVNRPRVSPFNDPFFEEFFGGRFGGFNIDRGPRELEFRAPSGQGSGFIIDSSGIILTNAHVVKDAAKVIVRLGDGREFTATDVRSDARSDVAVIRISVNERLPSISLGDDEAMEIGDWVLAFGSPFGMHRTVTQGIISSKGRGLAGDGDTEFLQTDAAINPGNSGGPLVNLNGEVIGINTAISTRSGGYDGVSFAVPASLVKWVSDQLLASNSVKRAFIGIVTEPIDARLAQKFKLSVPRGAVVVRVAPGSPAAQAGLQTGDVVLAIGNRPVQNPLNLMSVVERLQIGRRYDVKVLRDGVERTAAVTVEQVPSQEVQRERNREAIGSDGARVPELGITAQNLTANLARQLELPSADGVVITEVESGGVAARSGMKAGMQIVGIGNRPIKTIDDLLNEVEQSRQKGRILMLVKSANGAVYVDVPFRSGR